MNEYWCNYIVALLEDIRAELRAGNLRFKQLEDFAVEEAKRGQIMTISQAAKYVGYNPGVIGYHIRISNLIPVEGCSNICVYKNDLKGLRAKWHKKNNI